MAIFLSMNCGAGLAHIEHFNIDIRLKAHLVSYCNSVGLAENDETGNEFSLCDIIQKIFLSSASCFQ